MCAVRCNPRRPPAKKDLENGVDRGEDEVFRLPHLAARERRQPLQVPAQGPALQIAKGQFPKRPGVQLRL